MTESAGKFISPFIEGGLQQLEPEENDAFTMPDVSLFDDSLDDSYHAKTLGLTTEANRSAVASKSGADLDDSLCMEEEGMEEERMETSALENDRQELENTLLDGPNREGLQADMAVVPKPSPEGKLPVSPPEHIVPDHLSCHPDNTNQADHTTAEKEHVCEDYGNTGSKNGKTAANDNKVVPTFGNPRKGVATPKVHTPPTKKPDSTSANQTPAKTAAPDRSDSGAQLGQDSMEQAKADKDSSELSVTSRPQKPKYGPSKHKKPSAKSTSKPAAIKTGSKVKSDKQTELDQDHGMGKDDSVSAKADSESSVPSMKAGQPQKPQFGTSKCKATGTSKPATNESSIKGPREEKSTSKAEKKAEQERKQEEREAKKKEKEQQKLEREKKRAEMQQQKEEKKLEQERKKAEKEQKKVTNELKRIKRDQQKALKETAGQKKKKKGQPKTAKGSGEHDGASIPDSKPHSCPSNSDKDDSNNGAATKIMIKSPPGPISCEEGNPEPICVSAKATTSEDREPQTHQQDSYSSSSSPNVPSEPRLTGPSDRSPQQSEATTAATTAMQVSSGEEDTTKLGSIPGPEKSTRDGDQIEENRATNGEGKANDSSLALQESGNHPTPVQDTDKDMEGGNVVASPESLLDASLNGTETKENIKPNSSDKTKPSSIPRGFKDCHISLEPLQVKTASVKPKLPGKACKQASNKSTTNPKARRKPPASKQGTTKQPPRKRKGAEPAVGTGSDSYTSDPDSNPPRKKHRRSVPANHSGPVWVQCEKPECQKWRQLRDCLDPSTVPSRWECSMNSDPGFNSCSAPEEQCSDLGESQEYVESPFIPGSIVWARMGGYPWWPAMVEEDPDEETYYEMSGSFCTTPVKYHVVFLDTPVCRAWIPSGLIQRYEGNADMNGLNGVNVPQKYRRSLKQAMKRSERALTIPVKERLTEFSFSKRYRKTSGSRKRAAKSTVADHTSRFSGGGSLGNPKPGTRKSARVRAASTEPDKLDGNRDGSEPVGQHGSMAIHKTK